jgi:hypothetical protein
MYGAGRRGSLASRNRRVACEAPSNSRAARPTRVMAKPAEELALVEAPPGASGDCWAGDGPAAEVSAPLPSRIAVRMVAAGMSPGSTSPKGI